MKRDYVKINKEINERIQKFNKLDKWNQNEKK